MENHIEAAFVRSNFIKSFHDNQYNSISRTDRGVNAVMNCFLLELDRSPNLKIINSQIKEGIPLLIYDFSEVGDDFNPRSVDFKVYQYFLSKSKSIYEIERLQKFVGEYDYFSFIKPDGAGAFNSMTAITKIEIFEESDFYKIEIYGDKFGREQIRRMIGFILDPKFRYSNPKDFLNRRNKILSIKPVAPQFLTLLRVRFTQEFKWQGFKELSYLIKRLQLSDASKLQLHEIYLRLSSELFSKSTNISE